MVKGYYNKVNTYKFQNYTNVINNNNKKSWNTFEVKYKCWNLVVVLIKNKVIVLRNLNFTTITLKYIYAIKKQYLK